jgi:hypothetical protein
MGLPVTVYRWDDVGAPQIVNGTQSEFLDIFDKCLVDGYGAKLPLGWTTAFTSATSRIYRNATVDGGVGGCVKIERIGTNANYGSVRVTGCANATSITALINKGFYFSMTTEASVNRWIIIGTKLGFFFFTGKDGSIAEGRTAYTPSMYVGQFDPIYPNDIHCFIATTFYNNADNTTGNWTTQMEYGLFQLNYTIQKLYQTVSGTFSANHKIVHPMSPSNVGGQIAPTTVNNVFFKIPIMTQYDTQGADNATTNVDSSGVPYHRSSKMPALRGFLSGMLMRSVASDCEMLWPPINTIDGVKYYGIANGAYGGQQFFINMESW